MAEDKVPWNTIILLGALALGGYLIYKYLAKPISDIVAPIQEGIGQLDQPVIKIPDALPGVPKTPTPINYTFPITGIPGFLDFIKTPIGVLPGVNPKTPETGKTLQKSTPSTAAFLFPPVGVVEAYTKIPTLVTETTKAIGNPPLQALGEIFNLAFTGKAITGALAPTTKPTQGESRTVIPIISKSPTTGKLQPSTILKPLEIVQTGRLVHNTLTVAKTGTVASKTTGSMPISTTKTATVTKVTGIPTKITINKLIRS